MNVLKLTRTIIAALLLIILFPGGAEAKVDVVTKEQFALTPPETEQAVSYSPPDSIYVVPLSLKADEFISDSEWYKGIYYYQTFRLNKGDFLFHYFVTQDGQVFEGNSKGDQQRMDVRETNDEPVIIGYLAGRDDIDFENDSRDKLGELILDVANRNNIALKKVQAKTINYVAKEGETIFARPGVAGGRWKRTLDDIVDSIKFRYNPVKRRYTFEVADVSLPDGKVNVGDELTIDLTVTNTSDYFFYQGTDADPLISKINGDTSKFFFNEVWLSQTQAPLEPENAILQPGDSGKFSVKIQVPLYFGKQKEKFELIDSLGRRYADTVFTIEINVKKPKKEIVEITDTETGQLNVRSGPSGYASITSRVTPGQRFFVVERDDGGWVRLDLGDGKKGWVLGK
ncbi:MAG: SH3 domain-containing protein, partial [Candidatus Dojkabacteria bacterium]